MSNVFSSNPIKVDTAFSTSYKAVTGALRTDSRRHIEDRKPRSVGHTPPPPQLAWVFEGSESSKHPEASRTFVTVKTALWQVRKMNTEEVNASSGE
jgi:hypothetical protein